MIFPPRDINNATFSKKLPIISRAGRLVSGHTSDLQNSFLLLLPIEIFFRGSLLGKAPQGSHLSFPLVEIPPIPARLLLRQIIASWFGRMFGRGLWMNLSVFQGATQTNQIR